LTAQEASVYFNRSGLSGPDLQKIWILADQNKDNLLDVDEFILASVLCQNKLTNSAFVLPDVLPATLLTSYKSTPAGGGNSWIVTPESRLKYENYFNQVDSGRKGIIPGNVARNLFSASGLASNDLSVIWNLADMNQDGNLDKIEWCIAMHLIDCKRQKLEIPGTLPKQLLESLGIQTGPSPAELVRLKEEQERQQLIALKEEIIKKLKEKITTYSSIKTNAN